MRGSTAMRVVTRGPEVHCRRSDSVRRSKEAEARRRSWRVGDRTVDRHAIEQQSPLRARQDVLEAIDLDRGTRCARVFARVSHAALRPRPNGTSILGGRRGSACSSSLFHSAGMAPGLEATEHVIIER